MAGQGLDRIPLRVPERWDAAWFETFVRDVLSLADVRNAAEGLGISISGQSDDVATISASEDIAELVNASIVTVTASALDNARVLTAGNGITITDGGAGETITISAVAPNWYDIAGIPIYVADPTSPAWDYRIDGDVVGYTGVAGANDGLAAGSLTGDLVLAPTSGRVFVAATAIELQTAEPLLLLDETDADADERQWRWRSVAGVLRLDTYTDAGALGANAIAIDRTGTGVIEIELNATAFDFNGNLDLSGTALVAGLATLSNATLALTLASTAPRMSFDETNASSDRRLVDVIYDGAQLSMRTRTDADGTGITFFRMARGSGTAVSNVHVGTPSSWGLTAQATSSTIIGTNFSAAFGLGGITSSAAAVGSQTGVTITNSDGTDGARAFISISVDLGAQGAFLMSLPAANTTSYITNGPASGAYNFWQFADGPFSLAIANTEYARFSSSFNHWRVPNYFAPGDASAPGVSFLTTVSGAAPAADSNTGLYWIGADNVGFTAGGTLRFDYNATRALFAIRVDTLASATGGAGLRLPHGAAPSSPVDGDMWTTTAGLFVRINGATVGPLS